MNALVIANTSIRQDAHGRFSLNDLHRAAGANRKHAPSRWTRSDTYAALVAELTPELEFAPANLIRGGAAPGTFVCEDLVYAFAMWISPKFHLRVIRAYRQQTGKELRHTVGLLGQRLALETRDASSKVKATFGSKLMHERRLELPVIKAERAVLESVMQQSLFGLTSSNVTQ